MRTRALLCAIIGGVILVGCGSDLFRTKTRASCSDPHCHVKVFVAGGKVGVDIDELEIKGRNVRIHWHLPDQYVFDTDKGDGVILKRGDGDGQFYDQHASDVEEGQTPSGSKSGKHFHWGDRNTARGTYDYRIRFRDRSGTTYDLDPTIMNGG